MAFATNGGMRLYWRLDGEASKPGLMLLNSLGSDLGLWDRILPYLLPRYRVLRMDARGHGASDAPTGDYDLDTLAADALAVMAAAGLDRATVCGLSLGGAVAMTLALSAPERVEALILACTSAQMDVATWTTRIATVRDQGIAAVADTAIERFFSPPFRRTHPAEVETVRTGLLSMSADGYAGCAAALRDMDLIGRIEVIAAPTLVIGAARDVSTPYPEHGERIAAAITGARSAMLDTAHLACVEAPDAFAAAVCGFLDDVANGPARRDAAELQFDAGLATRRKVLGDAWVDRSMAGRTPFNADFQSMITRYAWDEIWNRPGLDHRTRRLLVVVITASLGRWEEFRLHVRAALEQGGFTPDELKEALMQTAIYAGVPAANTGFAEAGQILRELAGE